MVNDSFDIESIPYKESIRVEETHKLETFLNLKKHSLLTGMNLVIIPTNYDKIEYDQAVISKLSVLIREGVIPESVFFAVMRYAEEMEKYSKKEMENIINLSPNSRSIQEKSVEYLTDILKDNGKDIIKSTLMLVFSAVTGLR